MVVCQPCRFSMFLKVFTLIMTKMVLSINRLTMKVFSLLICILLCNSCVLKYRVVNVYQCLDQLFTEYIDGITTPDDNNYYILDFIDKDKSLFYLNFLSKPESGTVILFGREDCGLSNISSVWGVFEISGKKVYLCGEKNQSLFTLASGYVFIKQHNSCDYPEVLDDSDSCAFLLKKDAVYLIDFSHEKICPLN